MKKGEPAFRISFAAQMKPVPVAGFIIDSKNSVKSVSKVIHYRPPRIVRDDKHGWYIEYYYRIPVEVRPLYLNPQGKPKEWERFRIKDDVNRRKGKEKEEYAQWLCDEIVKSLKEGYNPFYPDQEIIEGDTITTIHEDTLNATDALRLFLEKWNHKGLENQSYQKYVRYVGRLIFWLKKKSIPYIEIDKVSSNHIEKFLEDTRNEFDLGNREFNNHLQFISTAFNFLLRKKYITENPCLGVDKLKTKSTKHRFYDSKMLESVTKALSIADPYTYLAFQSVYYLCIRSEKELKNLKVGNIKWDQNLILAEVSKTDQRYIPMDDHIKELFKNHIGDAPNNYYVFGIDGKPASKPYGLGFFSKRFRKFRAKIGLSSDYTLYGAKHTRVIHLKQDNASDADIMSLTGHKDFESYAKYLRDLGLDADPKKLSKLSRKI